MTQQTDRLNTALAGRYEIERELGAGGMATVFLAEDLKHKRKVALKVLKPELAAVLGAERFVVEITTTAAMQHPHILPLFDSGTADSFLFYVMPFIEGETLRDKLNRETQLGVDEAVRIAREVLDALEYAHQHGIVHRDVKPENILLHGGHAMVADFGIALAVSAAAGGRMTETGLSLGTPHYMSPEQATAEKEITARSDVYSLGSVLYEMLTGQPPHVGGSAQQIIMKIITTPAEAVTVHRKSVPSNVAAAVAKSLEKLPADRFESAKAFSEALGNVSYTNAGFSGTAAATMSGARSFKRPFIAASVLAAAAIAIAAWPMFTAQPPSPEPGRFLIEYPESVGLATNLNNAARVAISRDGSEIVFSGQSSSSFVDRALYIRRSNDAVATRVRGSDSAGFPSFSPDGKSLLYSTGRALKRVPSVGGAPQTLAVLTGDSAIRASSWGDRNRILFTKGRLTAARDQSLWEVSADGGEPRLVIAGRDTTRTGGFALLGRPELLPGATHALVVFTRLHRGVSEAVDSARIGVVSIADGALKDLGIMGSAPHFVAPGYLAFYYGGVIRVAPFSLRQRAITGRASSLLENVSLNGGLDPDFAVAQNGWLAFQAGVAASATSMWVVDRRGGERPLKGEPRLFTNARVSPDSRRVAVVIGASVYNNGNIWLFDIESGALTPLTSDGFSYRPAWSRDGARIYYVNGTMDSTRIVSRPWDGSGAESVHVRYPMLAEIAPGLPHGLSAIRTLPQRDIFLAPTDSLQAMQPFIITPVNEIEPAVSPNGRWIAYVSDESHRHEVYVRPIPGPGARVPVSVDGGFAPRWSSDGRTIYYRGETHVMAAAVIEQPQFAIARRDTLFADTYSRMPVATAFDVFPDGRGFLMLKGRAVKPQLFIVVNWQQLIGKSGGVGIEP